MKVFVGIPCLMTGGTEIQTLSLVEALIDAGHKVRVACYFEFNPAMIERFKSAGAEVVLLNPESSRPVGIKAVTRHLWKGLKKCVREFKPDVAHVQYMAPGALPVIILRTLGVKKIIATAHTAGDIYSKNGLRLIRFLANHILSGFQCITERAERSYFGSSKLFDGKLTKHFTIYNNLPSQIKILTTPRQDFEFKSQITVGVVSRLEKIKGMDLVIPAFAKAYDKNPNIRLLIVGDGSLKTEIEKEANDKGLISAITFTGIQSQECLQSFYDKINILLMPSRSEGFGLTAIEGMARGCVPIVANVGGLPEVVEDNVSGMIHNAEDIDDLAKKIVTLSTNPDLLSEMSANSLKRVQKFSRENYNKSIKVLYSQL